VSTKFIDEYKKLDYVSALRTILGDRLEVRPVPGWQTRRVSRRPFNPQGITYHHTAGGGSRNNSLALITKKVYAGLYLGRDHILRVVSATRTGHCGTIDERALNMVRKGQQIPWARNRNRGSYNNGYEYLYGIEVENNGVGEPWSKTLLDAMFLAGAAHCVLHGWDAGHVCTHQQLTNRKLDPAGPGLLWPYARPGQLWSQVSGLDIYRETDKRIEILTGASPSAPYPKEGDAPDPANLPLLRYRRPIMRGPDVSLCQRLLGLSSTNGMYGEWTARRVRRFQTEQGLEVDGMVGFKTWSRLIELAENTGPVQVGAIGDKA